MLCRRSSAPIEDNSRPQPLAPPRHCTMESICIFRPGDPNLRDLDVRNKCICELRYGHRRQKRSMMHCTWLCSAAAARGSTSGTGRRYDWSKTSWGLSHKMVCQDGIKCGEFPRPAQSRRIQPHVLFGTVDSAPPPAGINDSTEVWVNGTAKFANAPAYAARSVQSCTWSVWHRLTTILVRRLRCQHQSLSG